MSRSVLMMVLAVVVAACGTGSGPGSPATTLEPAPMTFPTANPTVAATAVASAEPSAAPTAPPPSGAPAGVLTGIVKADVTRIGANTGQACMIDSVSIECQNGSQTIGIQAGRAGDAISLVAVTANTNSTDSVGYAYLKQVCSFLGSYAPAVIAWIGAHRGQTASKQFGPYRIDYSGPLGQAIIGIRPSK
jgi:hypothetical protein